MGNLVRQGHETTDSGISLASVCHLTWSWVTANVPVSHTACSSREYLPIYWALFICALSRRFVFKLYCLTDINNGSLYIVLMNRNEYKEMLYSQGL